MDPLKVHFETLVVDAHCDTMGVLAGQGRRLKDHGSKGHVDLPRLAAGGVNVQFFAVFVDSRRCSNPVARTLELVDTFYVELESNRDRMNLVLAAKDISRAGAEGKLAALLTVEGGEALAGKIETLRVLYRLGVRSLALTWNYRNELADGVLEARSGGGLSDFGLAVVREMNRLGMIVDMAHLSEKGYGDVLDVSLHPVIVSHANCRSLCDHPRNLSDSQIKALAAAGGVMGVCFYPDFVSSTGASLEKLLDHVEHASETGGAACVGIGSDFDGIDRTVPGLEDASRMPLITEGLLRRGFSRDDIAKILGGNLARIINEVLK